MSTLWNLLIGMLTAVIGLTTAFVLLTYVLALHEKRYRWLQALFAAPPQAPRPPALPPALVLKTLGLEILATLAAVFLAPTMKRRLDPALPWGQPPRRPILLVHGYAYNQAGWILLHRRLKRAGFGPVYALNLHPPFAPIEHFAAQVEKRAARIAQETGLRELILIGHSMGGLVCAYYAERTAAPGTVSDVITLGSPLQGTRIAALGYGPNAVQMTDGSPFLKDLNARMLANRQVRYRHIASELDNMILPSGHALLGDDPERNTLLEDQGHVMLLFSAAVADRVIDHLAPVYSAIDRRRAEAAA